VLECEAYSAGTIVNTEQFSNTRTSEQKQLSQQSERHLTYTRLVITAFAQKYYITFMRPAAYAVYVR